MSRLKLIRQLTRPLIATMVAVALASGAVAADLAEFDLRIAGFKAGELSVDTAMDGPRYTVTTRIDTTGLIGAVMDYKYRGKATGRIGAGGQVLPQAFVASSRSPRDERVSKIDFENGTPVFVSVEPPRKSHPDPSKQGGTLDPVSATVAILGDKAPGEICDTTIDIFDGSRRTRLSIDPATTIEGGFECAGVYARLEGEAHTFQQDRAYPFRVVYVPNGSGRLQVSRIEAPTNFGTAVVERRLPQGS